MHPSEEGKEMAAIEIAMGMTEKGKNGAINVLSTTVRELEGGNYASQQALTLLR